MTLAHLVPDIATLPPLRRTLKSLSQRGSAHILDMPDAARLPMMAAAIASLGRPTLIVTARRDRADSLTAMLGEYMPSDHLPRAWPAQDALPYEQLPVDLDTGVARVKELDRMLHPGEFPGVWVTPVAGLAQFVIPPNELTDHTVELSVGKRRDIGKLVAWAHAVGYQQSPIVQEPGTIARRGSIVDIFPPGEDLPVRIDFFDDEIESLRRFDPHNQRSIERLQHIRLLPTSALPVWRLPGIAAELDALDTSALRIEVRQDWNRRIDLIRSGTTTDSLELLAGHLVPEKATLLEYFPVDSLVILDQPDAIRLAAGQHDTQAGELLRTFLESGELPGGIVQPYEPSNQIFDRIHAVPTLRMGADSVGIGEPVSASVLTDPGLFSGNLPAMTAQLRALLQKGWKIVLATDQVERLTDILEANSVYPRREKAAPDGVPVTLASGTCDVRTSDLPAGWSWPRKKVAVWTDFEIFGFRKQVRRGGIRTSSESRSFVQSLQPGEHVVHVDHGIAKFTGLIRMTTHGVEREYLLLEYERGDKLYVPVDQSDRVTRYSGGGLSPSLNRLGSGDWARTTRRVKRAVREMAFELIQLYAYRESGKGYQFPPNGRWDEELAESFPFVETGDQAKAIVSVTKDMESSQPMDRLVCGDVGYGKTEIAIRAAFKAVNSGRQVAMLVPTTVLALQHFTTFRERLAAFPVRVEMLSRIRTRQEQETVVEGMKSGSVDIVIGTHRLVQRDIQFKDMGLVIVDEEQRFGVRHKEFLKQLRTEVDVLTLSATPIPRTLHLSLSGIRDISMIETAPSARLPIRTFVTAFNPQLVREVVLRELDRAGQVFIVHNRVHDIDQFADKIRKVVPEARIGIGHGQMDEHVLEEVMLGFVRRDFDVLVSTTIIESGVDIPNVNTIIIDNADTLGLTQLYQLRGRVGRSTHRAYAYLLHQPHKVIRGEALERLETIQEATELGAGLRVAMRDLEIRGAGNILGAEQSGHIVTVGYELYMRLLSQAVEEVRSGAPILEAGPVTLDLPVTALLPESYIPDTELRLNLYRQIAAVNSLLDVSELEDELRDRFGDFPEEVEHLFALIRLRVRCTALGIGSVVEREREIVIRPVVTTRLERRRLDRSLGSAVRITPNSVRIRLLDLRTPWQEALEFTLTEIERTTEPGQEIAAD